MDDRAGDKGSWRCMCLRSSAWWCKGCDWTRRWIKTCGRVGCDDLQICDDGGVGILPRESFKGLQHLEVLEVDWLPWDILKGRSEGEKYTTEKYSNFALF